MLSSKHISKYAPPTLDIYALSSLIKDQFEHHTQGESILVYADGQIRYVHRYDCITYHLVDPDTPAARCVVTCIEYTEDDSSIKGNCQLSYFIPDLTGALTVPCFHDVLIKDQIVLSREDMIELLMSNRLYSHITKYGFV
ncbi:hypothetical protein DFH28DRAFT_931822 [Melampsora americana]|nr:hypothetical protein DFH28DRAFT_931822 [Melampsora americana]